MQKTFCFIKTAHISTIFLFCSFFILKKIKDMVVVSKKMLNFAIRLRIRAHT